MGFFGAAHGWGEGGRSHNYETWRSYNLPKEDRKKYMNQVTHSLSSADINLY